MDDNGYRFVCLICGGATGDFDKPEERIRGFSFGGGPDSARVVAAVAVCRLHVDVPLNDLRRFFYERVFQCREMEGGFSFAPSEDAS